MADNSRLTAMRQFLSQQSLLKQQPQPSLLPLSSEHQELVRPSPEGTAPELESPESTTAVPQTAEHDFSQVSIQPPDHLGIPLDLTDSVGKDGQNTPEDVAQVQSRLNLLSFGAGDITGQYDDQLAEAIQTFQAFFLREPNGLIEVDSVSHQRLSQLPSATAAKTPKPKSDGTNTDETDEVTPLQAPQFKVKRHREFVQSIDGKMIDSKLMQTLEAFFKFLVTHQHVNDDIMLLEGMRDARKAHRWSTAYAIRNDQIPLETLKKLPGGRDADGNRWYVEGETPAQIRRRAADVGLNSPSTPAAEGYPRGESKQFPNEWDDGISNHLIGKAVKVLIPWTTEKAGQLIDPIANEIIKKFGLHRPVPKDETHFELLQGTPKGEEEHGHRDSET